MSDDDPARHDRSDPDPWTDPESEASSDQDDLDRAFGPDTASVATRTRAQRVRSWSALGVGVVVSAGVIVVVLGLVIASIQTGIGGIFPKPEANLDRFAARAQSVTGVRTTKELDPEKTSFAGYDAVTDVTVDRGLDAGDRADVVDQLSAAAAASGGNGVHVYGVVDFGDLVVGVSGSERASASRLEVAERVKQIGGVTRVHCVWTHRDGGRSDAAGAQTVIVETPGTGDALGAIAVVAGDEVHRVFPDATVRTAAPGEG